MSWVYFAVFIGFAVLAHLVPRLRRRRALVTAVDAFRHAAGVLDDAEADDAGSMVRGRSRGMPTTFRFVTRGSGSSSEPWTEVEVTVPAATMFEMELRPQTPAETRRVATGRAIDVELGDPAFDPLYIVEAAPADAAARVLDHRTRALLVALHPCEVQYSGTRLQLAKSRWQEHGSMILDMVSLASQLAGSIGPACAALEEARIAAATREPSASTYRGADPEALRMAADFADPGWELASLHRVRAERKRASARLVGYVAAGTVAAFVLVWLAERC